MRTEIVGVERAMLESWTTGRVSLSHLAEMRALLAQPASDAHREACKRCGGSGSDGGRVHSNGVDTPEYEAYRCDACDGFGSEQQPASEAVVWREHSANYAKGEKPPATLETLQAAWDRDQEVINDQRGEISKLKETVNQLRQKKVAPAVPDGWKLVPVEPTQEMRNAGYNSTCSHAYMSCYREMLAAAPGRGDETADKGVV